MTRMTARAYEHATVVDVRSPNAWVAVWQDGKWKHVLNTALRLRYPEHDASGIVREKRLPAPAQCPTRETGSHNQVGTRI